MDCWKRLYSDVESEIWSLPWDVRVCCGYCADSEIWQLTAPMRQNFFFLLFQKLYFHDWTILEKCTFSSSQCVSHCTFLFSWMICFSWMTLVTESRVFFMRAPEVLFCFCNMCMLPPGSSRESWASRSCCMLCWLDCKRHYPFSENLLNICE